MNLVPFGWFKGLPYSDCNDDFEEYKKFRNDINKSAVLAHMKTLGLWATSLATQDIFTGERLQAGLYNDGEFVFPADFVHYYENYDIGIPYEYEEYLKSIGVGK